MRHEMRNINNILHFSAANIDFSAKYTSDFRFLASSQLSGDGQSTLTATRRCFARLMLQGIVAATLKWVSGSRGGVHNITPDVIKALHEKHPEKSEASVTILEQLATSPPPSIDPIIFEEIDETSIDKAAKTTKGSAGPSGMDSDMWRRKLCSKAYGSAPED